MLYDFDLLVEKLNSDKMIDAINFKINLKTKSMLGIKPCEKCQFIRLVNYIIKKKSMLGIKPCEKCQFIGLVNSIIEYIIILYLAVKSMHIKNK